jgi:DNA-directed RNA polymerase specialized sigma24 family protein
MLLWALTRHDAPAYAELARQTGMPIGSIGPTRGRYLRRLRQLMEDAGLGAEAWH